MTWPSSATKTAGFKFKDYVTAHDYLKEFIVAEAGQTALESSGTFYAKLPSSEKARFDVLGSAQFTASKISFE